MTKADFNSSTPVALSGTQDLSKALFFVEPPVQLLAPALQLSPGQPRDVPNWPTWPDSSFQTLLGLELQIQDSP